jgi:DNA-binding NtrC family response regulator
MAKPILIVDDEPQIRSMLKKLLSRNGFETIEARDGQNAISTVRELSGDIAALVTDIDMKGMSGIELAKTVQSEFPTIQILLLSAVPNWEGELNRGVPGSVFLQKPFDPAMLVQTLKHLLA